MTIVSEDNRESIILDILSKEFDVPVEKLQPSVSLIQDLGADSLSLINVMMQAEESLHVELSEDEWRSLSTVGDILTRLRSTSPVNAPEPVAQS